MFRNEAPTGRIAAIDLGRARLGLAWTDPGQEMALPHSVIARLGTKRDIVKLLEIFERGQVASVVLGVPPESPDGLGTAHLARQFAQALADVWPHPVGLVDEADTTVEAHAELRALGMRAARRRREVDAVAAARILDRFLGGAPALAVPPQSM